MADPSFTEQLNTLGKRLGDAATAGLRWLSDHTGVVIAVLSAVASAIVFGRHNQSIGPADRLQVELDAVAAKTQVAAIAAEKGAEAAHAHVAAQYSAQLQALDERQTQDAQQLKGDPAALAAYLVRVGGAALAAKAVTGNK